MVKIREAKAPDFRAISGFKKRIFKKTSKKAQQKYDVYLKFNIALDRCTIFIIEDKNDVKGFVVGKLYTTPLIVKNRLRGHISSFHLDDRYKKYSNELLKRILAWFRSKKADSVYIEMNYGKREECSIFKMHGFKAETSKLVKKI